MTHTHRGEGIGALDITVELDGDGALLRLAGPIDERFSGFAAPRASVLVMELSGVTRVTSFGVRQWVHGMSALPAAVGDIYFLGCPPPFVDQLNLVFNFAGRARVLTVLAPWACPACKLECELAVDVMRDRERLASVARESRPCPRCRSPLEFDDLPQRYFSFVPRCGATLLHPTAARLLARAGLYGAEPEPGP